MHLSKTFFFLTFSILSTSLYAQAEVMGWGNIQGIRVEGQLFGFETSICMPDENWNIVQGTAKEQQNPQFSREGNTQIITTQFDDLQIRLEINDPAEGQSTILTTIDAENAVETSGIYFCLELPAEFYAEDSIQLNDNIGFSAESSLRQIELSYTSPAPLHVQIDTNNDIQIFVPLIDGNISENQHAENTFSIKASGTIDRNPITLSLNSSNPGRRFDGLGGNFRLQNPDVDPMVIDYNLEHLRVSMARLEMPWNFWHPDEDKDPIEEAEAGNLHPRVAAAMELAQRFAQMDIPVLLADWSGPRWAIEGEMSFGPGPDGVRGNPLRKDKSEKIYASIAAYIQYLKDHYGVEVEMFSFNESDLGINVRHTGQEHADFIKGLGAQLANQDLQTKLLLGDTADANGWWFLKEAMDDPEAHKYIGAISFHSWRGWDEETLQRWANAAKRMNLPLIVGEGSTDAAAWRFPIIFDEATFAQQEINLYVRILAISEPQSILQWQLTSDYSILAGGGLFGNDDEALRPTQRFWNLKQLADTPEGSFALPIESSSETISAAAFGEIAKNLYTVHIANNGAARRTTIAGLPDSVESLHLRFTSDEHEMDNLGSITVTKGSATFELPALGFASLYSEAP